MKKTFFLLLTAAMLALPEAGAQVIQLLVKPEPSVLNAYPEQESMLRWLQATCSPLESKGIQVKFTALPGARYTTTFNSLFVLDISPADAAPEAEQFLKSTGHFAVIERVPGATVQAVTPDDAAFSKQWGWKNTGTQTPLVAKTTADAKIQAAWDYTTGSDTVVVAVVDAGVRLDHPEFRGRLWINMNEIPGNSIDDDSNDYVDDVQGYNFCYSNANPNDDNGHGTMVAGIIGANGNNGIGLAGIDWKCRIMPVKVADSTGFSSYVSMIYGIIYAVDNGADVINISIVGYSPFAYLDSAVDYARQHDVIFAAAAGNNNLGNKTYPASIEPVIAVGSSNPDDSRSVPFTIFYNGKDTTGGGSNYGSYLDIVAPGNYMYILDFKDTNNYGSYNSGTSFASPMVAGTAALLKAYYPSRTATEIRNMILNGADDQVGNLTEDVPGRDNYYGYGRLNALRAFTASTNLGVKTPVEKGLTIYPNPAGEKVTLVLAQQDQGGQVWITDMLGRTAYSGIASDETVTISLAGLAPGCYLLHYRNADTIRTEKLIRQ